MFKIEYDTRFSLGSDDDDNAQQPAAPFVSPLLALKARFKEDITASLLTTLPDDACIESQVIRCRGGTEKPSEQALDQDFIAVEENAEHAQGPEEPQDEGPGEFIQLIQEAPVVQNKEDDDMEIEDAGLNEADIALLGQRPYWMKTCRHIKSPLLRLHQEILELVELLQPTDEEMEQRNLAVKEVSEAIHSIWPHANVQVFGSFSTGLFVPTSDIDVVIMDSDCKDVQSGLKALAAQIQRKGVAPSVVVVAKAKVPIIKFETTRYGGLAFDISFDVANGPQAAELVRDFVMVWPMMRPLVLILKLFLQQRELNEVYTGGIGSYALLTLVASYLQLHNSRRPKNTDSKKSSEQQGKSSKKKKDTKPGPEGNSTPSELLEPSLGVLLVDFFRMFGRVINIPEVGLTATHGGLFFKKADKVPSWLQPGRHNMLSVQDPKDDTNDICRGSFNMGRVKAAFDFAYQQLTAPSHPEESLLARILRLGPILASRKPPSTVQALYKRPLPAYLQPGQGKAAADGAASDRPLSGKTNKTSSQDKKDKDGTKTSSAAVDGKGGDGKQSGGGKKRDRQKSSRSPSPYDGGNQKRHKS